MYYVKEKELRGDENTRILNNGEPFENVEDAQKYYNGVYNNARSDYTYYYELMIVRAEQS